MTRTRLFKVGLTACTAISLTACDPLSLPFIGEGDDTATTSSQADEAAASTMASADLSDLRDIPDPVVFEEVILPPLSEWTGLTDLGPADRGVLMADARDDAFESWWVDLRDAPEARYRVTARLRATDAPSSVLIRLENRSTDPMERFDIMLDLSESSVSTDGNARISEAMGEIRVSADSTPLSAGDLRVRIFPAARLSTAPAMNRAATGSVIVESVVLERRISD